MSKEFKVGVSPLTNRIYCGNVSKGKWGINKRDITDGAVSAVAEHLFKAEEALVFTIDDKEYILKVDKYTNE